MQLIVGGVPTDVTSGVIAELTRRGHRVTQRAAAGLVHVAADDGRAVVIGSASTPDTAAGALLIRSAPVLGRASTGATRRRFAAPIIVGVAGRRNLVRFIHHDDLARFTADAVEHPEWSGRVDLAAPDVLPLSEVAALLGKPYVEVPGWPAFGGCAGRFPDTTRLGELGFVPAWTGRDCVADFHRPNAQHIYLGPVRLALPWRFPFTPAPPARPDRPGRHPANDQGLAGEFDTTINPAWPAFTCANIAEAFPGPMTPLSLELALEALRATGSLAADLVQLTGELRRAVTEEQVGCFGHTIYVNLTASHAASSMLPGADPAAWRNLLFGAESGVDGDTAVRINVWAIVARLPKLLILLVAAPRETRRIDAEARDQQRDRAHYAGCTDDQLHAQLRWLRDAVASSWAVAALGSAGVVPIMGLIERLGGKRLAAQFKGGAEQLASAGLLRGTYALAEYVRADPAFAALLGRVDGEEAWRELRGAHAEFAARLDAVIAEYGHRGPSETELAGRVFADTPARLVEAVAKLAGSAARPVSAAPPLGPALQLLGRLGAEFQRSRERARDAAVRYTHNYRLIARELGARLAAAGVIERPGDVCYLLRDELTNPPPDVNAVIARRKAERARLARYRLPTYFTDRWEPRHDPTADLQPGESLTGIPAAAGSAKGRVRILTADSIDDFQPGEVLVAECTDTGWTPFFSYAAAVVVDTGAEMSHAAVIAREFDIPCVVGAVSASRMLRTGQVIEVDGSAGRITRVD